MNSVSVKAVAVVAAVIMTAAATGCNINGGSMLKAEPFNHDGSELLLASDFSGGFYLRSTTPTDGAKVVGQLLLGNPSSVPEWSIAQWGAKVSLSEAAEQKLPDGSIEYSTAVMSLSVNTNAGLIKQRVIASANYDGIRHGSEQWLHQLAEQYFSMKSDFMSTRKNDYNIASFNKLWATGRFKLTYFKDCMDGKANNGEHCASYLFYLNMQNLNKASDDFGKLMHFGLNIFDNRTEYTKLYCAKDLTTPNYIYSVGSESFLSDSFFRDGAPFGSESNNWITLDLDVLPYIKTAFDDAKSKGFLKNTEFSDLYITAYSIGWEVPGTYDAEMWAKDLSLKAVK